jgi:hypothetical protein
MRVKGIIFRACQYFSVLMQGRDSFCGKTSSSSRVAFTKSLLTTSSSVGVFVCSCIHPHAGVKCHMTHTLTIKEIAAKTGRTVRQLQRLAATGDLPSKLSKNGYHRIYPNTAELRDWVARKAGTPRGRRAIIPKPRGDSTHSSELIGHLQKAVIIAEDVWTRHHGLGYSLPASQHVRRLAELLESFEGKPAKVKPSLRFAHLLDD